MMGVSDDCMVIVCVICLFIYFLSIYLDVIRVQTINNHFALCNLLMQTRIQLQIQVLYIEMMNLDVKEPNHQYKVAIYGINIIIMGCIYKQLLP